jgi:NitT/TauT family transport system ATP-binding protein
VDPAAARSAAAACFRPDLYRAALGPIAADLPGASSKVEGALDSRTAVASSRGETFLGPDRFFDGRRFDPDAPDA